MNKFVVGVQRCGISTLGVPNIAAGLLVLFLMLSMIDPLTQAFRGRSSLQVLTVTFILPTYYRRSSLIPEKETWHTCQLQSIQFR